jgi:AraC-like DNA-binding protein
MLLKEELPPGLCYQFCLEEYLALVMNMGGQMFGKPITYRSLDISYSAPRHAALYEQLFDCPVNFDMGFNRISVLSPGLDDFIETRDEYLYGIYQRYCERQSKQQAHRGAYAYKVHNYLLKNLGNPPSLEALARQLDCSTATLRRRLNSEDLNFRDLVNSFRRDFAEEHFKSTNLSAKEVAYLLGYTDTKPFLRAFKLWTGMTVGDYRRTHSVASNA